MQNQDLKTRCFQFSIKVIEVADTLPQKRSAWVISDQLIRSATSIGANIIEARASSSRLEFKKFFEISLKSANETIYWIELLRETKLLDIKTAQMLLDEATQLSKMLGSSVLKLKGLK